MTDHGDTESAQSGSQPAQSAPGQACDSCGKPRPDLQPITFVVGVLSGETSTQSGSTVTTVKTYEGPSLERTLYFCPDCKKRERRTQARIHFGSAVVAAAAVATCAWFWLRTAPGSDKGCVGWTGLIAFIAFVALVTTGIPWLRSRATEKRLRTMFSNEIDAEARRLKPENSPESVTTWLAEDFHRAYPDKPTTRVG